MGALLPAPLVPHKSFVCILPIKPGLSGSGIGIKVSVPKPALLSCTKFKVEKVAAAPACCRYTPWSWTKILAALPGVTVIQRIPPVSWLRYAPFTPEEFVESNISLVILKKKITVLLSGQLAL